MLTNLLIKYKC